MKKLGLVFCIYLSVIYGICTGFEVEEYRGFVIIVAVFFFLYWSVLSSDFFHNNRQLQWIQYVQYFGLAGYVIYESESCLRGGKILANRLIDIVNTTFHREFTYFLNTNEKAAQSDMIIFVVISLLLYSGILLLSRRRAELVILYTMPVMIFVMILAPRAVHGNFFLYFAGILALYYLEHHKKKCAVMGFLIMFILGLIFELYPSTELFGQEMSTVRQGIVVILEYANNVIKGETSVFTLKFGDLKQKANKKHKSRAKMKITMDSVEEKCYLRGYIGKDYDSGRWQKDKQAMDESRDFIWEEKVFDYLDADVKKALQPSIKNMKIQYFDENRKEDFYPYFVQTRENDSIQYVVINDFENLLNVRIPEYDENIPSSYYAKEQNARDDARKNYLTVPGKIKDTITQMRSEFFRRGDSILEIDKKIKNYLRENYTYTSNTITVPDGEDPMLYFLQKSKRGYCSQYASAAVFMFRSCGIPARYTEGYVLKEEDFRDGTVTDGKIVLNIKEENAYAWVEIYADGIGWVPVDVVYGTSLVAASDAREINLPNLPKITKSMDEMILGFVRILILGMVVLLLRVFFMWMFTSYRKEKMERSERICWYAVVWERYAGEEKDPAIEKIIQCARYSDHEMTLKEEMLVYHEAMRVRDEYRKKLPVYMNLFDVLIMCRDIL